jgi:hypothetical protein
MPRRDPVAVLARLRALELRTARRGAALAAARLAEAEGAAEAQDAARRAEAAGASPADYAAWRPGAEARRGALAGEVRTAEAGSAIARGALTTARAAARLVERVRAERRTEARCAALRREAAALDDVGRRWSRSRSDGII